MSSRAQWVRQVEHLAALDCQRLTQFGDLPRRCQYRWCFGLGLISEIKAELLGALDRGEARTLAELVGIDAADITAQPWPE